MVEKDSSDIVKSRAKKFLITKDPTILEEIVKDLNFDINNLESCPNEKILLKAAKDFETIFTTFIPDGGLHHLNDCNASEDVIKFRELYVEGVEHLASISKNFSNSKTRVFIIEILIDLLKLEKNNVEKLPQLGHGIHIRLLESITDADSKLASNVSKLKEYMKYVDFRLESVKALTRVLKAKLESQKSEEFMKNVLNLIGTIVNNKNFDEESNEIYYESNQSSVKLRETPCEMNYKEFQREFSHLWDEVMKWQMTNDVLKRVVLLLPEKIMPHLKKPLHMSGFLLDCFKLGGPLSILSLQGIFTLMVEHNFEVPDFYTKLYSLFQLAVFDANYRARFFAYSFQFLTSTHLPEYLVGSFAKKLSRLSLLAPAPCLPMIFDFITNLMILHPGLSVLVAKKEGPMTLSEDPFLEHEMDPMKSRALESSLWEIKSHRHHAIPSIANWARFIEKPLPKVEKDLDDTLSLTYADLFQMEVDNTKGIEPKFKSDYAQPKPPTKPTIQDKLTTMASV